MLPAPIFHDSKCDTKTKHHKETDRKIKSYVYTTMRKPNATLPSIIIHLMEMRYDRDQKNSELQMHFLDV